MFPLVVLSLWLVHVEIVGGMQRGSPRSMVHSPGVDLKAEKFWNKVEREINQTAKRNDTCNISCYCDQFCTVFDDCCAGANTTSFSWKQVPKDTFTCKRIPGIIHKAISIVNMCPLSYGDADIRSECETTERNGLLNVPVSDVVTNILYRNVYCALCHNVTKYVYWLQEIKCLFQSPTTPPESFPSFKANHRCLELNKFYHPNFTHRVCTPHVSSCSAGWGDGMYKDACASYTNFTISGGHYYKNKYCALCNYEEADDRSYPGRLEEKPHNDGSYFDYSFAVIMNAYTGGHEIQTGYRYVYMGPLVSDSSFRTRCMPLEVYDQVDDRCRAWQCRP